MLSSCMLWNRAGSSLLHIQRGDLMTLVRNGNLSTTDCSQRVVFSELKRVCIGASFVRVGERVWFRYVVHQGGGN